MDTTQTFFGVAQTIDLSDLLSFVAIIITILVAYKSYKLSKSIARAQSKPVLAIYTSEYINYKAVSLRNVGNGTAWINSFKINRGSDEVDCLVELFNFKSKREVIWDNYWIFTKPPDYLQAGEYRMLVELSEKHLVKQKFKESEALNILKEWQKQLDEIEIKIHYSDITGEDNYYYQRKLVGR